MRTFQVGIKHRILYAVLLLSGFAFGDPAVDAATSRLSHVGVFAFGGVGFAGSISQGQKDFTFILSQPPAISEAAFRRVLHDGTIEARCYAAVGLSILHPEQLEALVAQLKAAGDSVLTMRGCLMSHQPVHEIADQVGSYQLRATEYQVKSQGALQLASSKSR